MATCSHCGHDSDTSLGQLHCASCGREMPEPAETKAEAPVARPAPASSASAPVASGRESIPRLIVSRLTCLAGVLCIWRFPDWVPIALYLSGLVIYYVPGPAARKHSVPGSIRLLLIVPAVAVFATYSWPKPPTSFIPPWFYYGSLAFFLVQVIFDIYRNIKARNGNA